MREWDGRLMAIDDMRKMEDGSYNTDAEKVNREIRDAIRRKHGG